MLHREGQPDGAPRRDRPARAGHCAELGLGMAGQPADHVQPRQRRSRRQAVESGQAAHRVERQPVGRHRRSRLRADHEAVRRGRPLHHECRGRGTPVRADPDGEGPFPEHYEPFESPVPNVLHPKVPIESGGARVRRRPGRLRHRAGLPLCRDDLPADRALPLLDQARADQRDPAAGGVHRDRRGAGAGKGHRAGRLGAAVLQARR